MSLAATLRARLASTLSRLAAALEKPVPNGSPVPVKLESPEIRPPDMYSVHVVDMWDYPDDDCMEYVDGFATEELATEYARRRTWSSVEKHRKPDQSREELRICWGSFGDSCFVHRKGDNGHAAIYAAVDHLDHFIDHVAEPWERDWAALEPVRLNAPLTVGDITLDANEPRSEESALAVGAGIAERYRKGAKPPSALLGVKESAIVACQDFTRSFRNGMWRDGSRFSFAELRAMRRPVGPLEMAYWHKRAMVRRVVDTPEDRAEAAAALVLDRLGRNSPRVETA